MPPTNLLLTLFQLLCYFAPVLHSVPYGSKQEVVLDTNVGATNVTLVTSIMKEAPPNAKAVRVTVTNLLNMDQITHKFPANQGFYVIRNLRPNTAYGVRFESGDHSEYRLVTTLPQQDTAASQQLNVAPALAMTSLQVTDQAVNLLWKTIENPHYQIDASATLVCQGENVTRRVNFTNKMSQGTFQMPLKDPQLSVQERKSRDGKLAHVRISTSFPDCSAVCWSYWVLVDTGEAFQHPEACAVLRLEDVWITVPLVNKAIVSVHWIALVMHEMHPRSQNRPLTHERYEKENSINSDAVRVFIESLDINRTEKVPDPVHAGLEPSYTVPYLEPDTWYEIRIRTMVANISRYAFEQRVILKTLRTGYAVPQIYPANVTGVKVQPTKNKLMQTEQQSVYDVIRLLSISEPEYSQDVLLMECIACAALKTVQFHVMHGCDLTGTMFQLTDEEPILMIHLLPPDGLATTTTIYEFSGAGKKDEIGYKNLSISANCGKMCLEYQVIIQSGSEELRKSKIGEECFKIKDSSLDGDLPALFDNSSSRAELTFSVICTIGASFFLSMF